MHAHYTTASFSMSAVSLCNKGLITFSIDTTGLDADCSGNLQAIGRLIGLERSAYCTRINAPSMDLNDWKPLWPCLQHLQRMTISRIKILFSSGNELLCTTHHLFFIIHCLSSLIHFCWCTPNLNNTIGLLF